MTIAVDFDGTIVRDQYPDIGREVPFATQTLKMLIKDGHHLVLWSVREGHLLDEAVEWCRERGVEFYAVNKNFEEESDDPSHSRYTRKLKVDMFIDDRNVGGLPSWSTIYQIIREGKTLTQLLAEQLEAENNKSKKKSWWRF